jgi:hypothetical protein
MATTAATMMLWRVAPANPWAKTARKLARVKVRGRIPLVEIEICPEGRDLLATGRGREGDNATLLPYFIIAAVAPVGRA